MEFPAVYDSGFFLCENSVVNVNHLTEAVLTEYLLLHLYFSLHDNVPQVAQQNVSIVAHTSTKVLLRGHGHPF